MANAFTDMLNASRRMIFGYSEEEKKQMQPVSNYLDVISQARIEKERQTNLAKVEAERFGGRYTPTLTLEEQADKRANEILNGETYTSGFSVTMPSFSNGGSGGSSGQSTDMFVIGLLAILVAMIFSK